MVTPLVVTMVFRPTIINTSATIITTIVFSANPIQVDISPINLKKVNIIRFVGSTKKNLISIKLILAKEKK